MKPPTGPTTAESIATAPATTGAAAPTAAGGWVVACALESLTPERGVAVLIEGNEPATRQIAVFLLHSGEVVAVGNQDPRSGANVMARGLIGSRDGRPTVCSPMFKDTFDLATGRCLTDGANRANPAEFGVGPSPPDEAAVSPMDLQCHVVRVVDGAVLIRAGS